MAPIDKNLGPGCQQTGYKHAAVGSSASPVSNYGIKIAVSNPSNVSACLDTVHNRSLTLASMSNRPVSGLTSWECSK